MLERLNAEIGSLQQSPVHRQGGQARATTDTTASILLQRTTQSITPTFFRSLITHIIHHIKPHCFLKLLNQLLRKYDDIRWRLVKLGGKLKCFWPPNLFTSQYSTEISINHHIPPLLWQHNDSQWEHQMRGCNIPPKILSPKSLKPSACRSLTFQEFPSIVRRQSSQMSPLGRDFSKAVSNNPFLSPNTFIR